MEEDMDLPSHFSDDDRPDSLVHDLFVDRNPYDPSKAKTEQDKILEDRIRKLVERSRDRTSKLLETETRNFAKENSLIPTHTHRQLSVTPNITRHSPLYQNTLFPTREICSNKNNDISKLTSITLFKVKYPQQYSSTLTRTQTPDSSKDDELPDPVAWCIKKVIQLQMADGR